MNWQTIVVLGVVVAIVAAIVVSDIHKRKKDETSCSCGCSCEGCALKGSCRH